jgi:Fe-S-cluster-containing hydrogenase component 2
MHLNIQQQNPSIRMLIKAMRHLACAAQSRFGHQEIQLPERFFANKCQLVSSSKQSENIVKYCPKATVAINLLIFGLQAAGLAGAA